MQALFGTEPVSIHLNLIDLLRLFVGQRLVVKERVQVICCREKNGLTKLMDAHRLIQRYK